MTGSYWAEGKYWFNYNPTPDTDATYNDSSFGFYEQDINLFPKITIDNTSLNFRIAITDVYWGNPDADGIEAITKGARDTSADDDNIQIERAFLTHKFSDAFTLDVGLMNGTQWGTTFADDNQPQWRVKGTATTKVGVLGFVLEKNFENGALTQDADGEGEDRDSYGLFGVTKAGSVYIKPLLWYVRSNDALAGTPLGDVDLTLFNPVLAFNGDLGGLSFEAELNYKMWNIEGGIADVDEDWDTFGIYLNLWKAMDKMTPGIILAYGSYDDALFDAAVGAGSLAEAQTYGAFMSRAVFDFDDDFDSSIILGDEYCWGGNGNDLQGMTMIKLYVNDIKTPIAPLTLFGYAEYVMSNQKDTDYEDATAYELALGANYKITDNLTYSVYGAFADIDYDVDTIDDPDSVYMVANAITFSF